MYLSIIIVNWNSKEYLLKCIGSITAQIKDIEYEIIVIDNASFDGSAEILHRIYPQVHFIQSCKNIGFARANNEAFKMSHGDIILFLNPDTVIIGSAINIMAYYLHRLNDIGAIGCKILNKDGTIQTSCIQAFPSITNQLLGSEFLRTLFPKSHLWGMTALFSHDCTPKEIDVISGACLMMKRTVFKQVRQFSEDYFMYAEDIDLCYKINKAGFRNFYIPSATIIHYGGGSTSKESSRFSDVMMRKSISRFMLKTKGYIYSLGYKLSVIVSAITRMMILFVSIPYYIIRGHKKMCDRSLKKWYFILLWGLGFYKEDKTF